MDWLNLVRRHYAAGRYTKENVTIFVEAAKLTAQQYEEITGEAFISSVPKK